MWHGSSVCTTRHNLKGTNLSKLKKASKWWRGKLQCISENPFPAVLFQSSYLGCSKSVGIWTKKNLGGCEKCFPHSEVVRPKSVEPHTPQKKLTVKYHLWHFHPQIILILWHRKNRQSESESHKDWAQLHKNGQMNTLSNRKHYTLWILICQQFNFVASISRRVSPVTGVGDCGKKCLTDWYVVRYGFLHLNTPAHK